MSCRLRLLLFTVLLGLLGVPATQAQQCSACDCYHIPISTTCEGCCGIATGKIATVTDSTVAITGSASASEGTSANRTFKLKPETRKNSALKEGAPATVFYRREGNVAERIDLLEALQGLLIPGSEPDPPLPSSCSRFRPVPQGALRVYLGDSGGYSMADEVSVLTIKGTDVLDLRRASNGLAIGAKTFSDDGKIIAQIIDNRFYVNPNNFFRMDRPDTHSLVVYDPHGRNVLDIKYINSHSVRVLGIFQIGGGRPVIITDHELTVEGGAQLFGLCLSGSKLLSVE
jgi:hypothetical protein